jgi:hypothetical protein
MALATLLPVRTTLGAVPNLPGKFTQIDMECGGYYPAIIQHWSGRLIGPTDGGGIYLSDNHGDSWKFLCGDMTTAAALCPQGIAVPQTSASSSSLILTACGFAEAPTDAGRGIWKTTNGGASWKQTLTGVNFSGGDQERTGGECIIFHPTNDAEAWAGTRARGLFKSVDAGSTWTRVSRFATNIITSVFIHPSYPDQIFVAGDGGLWASVDHGENWTHLKSFPLLQRVTRGADGTVYYGGVNHSMQVTQKITSSNWTDPSSYVYTDLHPAYERGISDNGNAITCLTVLRDGRLVAGDYDGSTRISSDEGGSFTTLPCTYVVGSVVPKWTSAATFAWRANSLIQDVNASGTWYGSSGYGAFRSDDGGKSWQYICSGIGEVVTYRVGFHPNDPNRIYIPSGDHAGAIVTDGGLSGNVASMATPFFLWPSDIVMNSHRAMACYTNGVNRVIFPGGCSLNNTTRLYESTNDGASWFHLAAVGLPTNISGVEIVDNIDSLDNPDDFLVLVGGSPAKGVGGVDRTTDAGLSFTQCNWHPTNHSLVIGVAQFWNVTLDRDATNVNVRYMYSHMAYPAPGFDNGGGFYISYDRGENWRNITPGTQGAVVPGDWSDWHGWILADKRQSGYVWMMVTDNKAGLLLSTNYGTNWSIVPGFSSVTAMDALNGNIVVYGKMTNDPWYGIYYSSNNGSSWKEITAPGYRFGNTSALSLDPYRPGRIFISTGERSVCIFTPRSSAPK